MSHYKDKEKTVEKQMKFHTEPSTQMDKDSLQGRMGVVFFALQLIVRCTGHFYLIFAFS